MGGFEAGVLEGGAAVGVDCAHELVASETARASPASTADWEAIRTLRMTSPPAQFHSRSLEHVRHAPHSPGNRTASLHYLDATHRSIGNSPVPYFVRRAEYIRKEAGQEAINGLRNLHSLSQYHIQFVAGLRLIYSGVHAEEGALPCED